MNEVLNMAPIALVSFGVVWAVGLRVRMTTEQKFLLSIVVAFLYGFIPQDFGNEILNRIKDAVGVAVGLTAVYQGSKNIVAKVSGM